MSTVHAFGDDAPTKALRRRDDGAGDRRVVKVRKMKLACADVDGHRKVGCCPSLGAGEQLCAGALTALLAQQ